MPPRRRGAALRAARAALGLPPPERGAVSPAEARAAYRAAALRAHPDKVTRARAPPSSSFFL